MRSLAPPLTPSPRLPQNLQDRAAACAQWSFAISLDPSLFQSHASLGHDRGHAGDLPAARAHYGAAIAAAGSQGMYNEVASLTLQVRKLSMVCR